MKIENLAILKKVISLCQKSGVTEISIDGITMKIDPRPIMKKSKNQDFNLELPPEAHVQVPEYTTKEGIEAFSDLTEEQKLFYSSDQRM